MTKTTTKSKKEKINIMGVKYKVEKEVSDTLKALSEALHAHEVALLTWVHKDFNGNDSKEDIKEFRNSLFSYCMNIPESANILIRMKELDAQVEEGTLQETEKAEGATE